MSSSPSTIDITLANPKDFPAVVYATERIVTKKALRPNPPFKFNVKGLEANVGYRMLLKLELMDGFLHKLSTETGEWMQHLSAGREEALPEPIFMEHHEGMKRGADWMREDVHFSTVSFSTVPDRDVIQLAYKRFYKMSLIVRRSTDGHEEVFLDPRHCFRAVSNHSKKYAEAKPKVTLEKAPKKRPAGENGVPRTAKRAARNQIDRNEQGFQMGAHQPQVNEQLAHDGHGLWEDGQQPAMHGQGFGLAGQSDYGHHIVYNEEQYDMGQAHGQAPYQVDLAPGYHNVAEMDQMWFEDYANDPQGHFGAINNDLYPEHHHQYQMEAYGQEQDHFDNLPPAHMEHQFQEVRVEEQDDVQEYPEVYYREEFVAAQRPPVPAQVSQEDMDQFNNFFVTPVFK